MGKCIDGPSIYISKKDLNASKSSEHPFDQGEHCQNVSTMSSQLGNPFNTIY